MIYGYIRVSTDKQSVESQKNAISRYCVDHKLMIDEWIEVEMSTSKSMEKRLMTALIDKLTPNDTIIVTEASRFARSCSELYQITDRIAIEKKAVFVCLHPFMEINTGNINSEENIIKRSYIGTTNQLEKLFISRRTKNGLEAAKARGVKLGAPKDKPRKSMYDKDREKIFHLYKLGVPINQILEVHLGYGKWLSLYMYIKKRLPFQMDDVGIKTTKLLNKED